MQRAQVMLPLKVVEPCYAAPDGASRRWIYYPFKRRIRQLTRRSGGRNLSQVAEALHSYLPGWKEDFRLAQTPYVFRELDEWLRHRLRALQLKHWRRGTTIYRELRAMGASSTKRLAGRSCPPLVA